MFAVTACDIDRVTNGNIPQETEMCVAMAGIYCNTALAGINRLVDVTGSKASACPLALSSTIALAPIRFTSIRATGQVSAHDHGLITSPVAKLLSKARSSSTCASQALAWT